MKVAFNTSSLTSAHKTRGIGFYTQRLYRALENLSRSAKLQLIKFDQKIPSQADLVHYPAFTLFHPFPHIPLRSGMPIVFTVHDLIPLKFPRHFPLGLKGRLKWLRQKNRLKKAAAIITDSKASKKDIIKYVGIAEDKITVIHLAADPIFTVVNNQARLDQIKKQYHLPEKFVLYVGDLNWNKNILFLTKACFELNYPLVVIGKQAVSDNYDKHHPENKALVEFQKLAVDHPQKILRLGFIPTNDLVAIYNLAVCLAQPSHAEGFGLPALEAMACGCPVIASQATSLAEIAGSAALLINPNKKQQLTKALQSCWQSQTLRQKLIRVGLKQVQQFSWDKTAQETLKVYQYVFKKS
jgi:glycosyltransferase involved in cell wall biosynthesis